MCAPVYYHLLNVFLLRFILGFYLEASYRSSTPVTRGNRAAKEKGSDLVIKKWVRIILSQSFLGTNTFSQTCCILEKTERRHDCNFKRHLGNGDKPASLRSLHPAAVSLLWGRITGHQTLCWTSLKWSYCLLWINSLVLIVLENRTRSFTSVEKTVNSLYWCKMSRFFNSIFL